MNERVGIITVNGDPLTLLGKDKKVGDKVEEYTVVDGALQEVSSGIFKDKTKVICSVPSLDTPICDSEIKRFNDEAAELSRDVAVIFISNDLPFAQTRFIDDNKLKKVKVFSDHKDLDFGNKFGVLIKENRLLARAVFIINKEDEIVYYELVDDLGHAPDYGSALNNLKELV